MERPLDVKLISCLSLCLKIHSKWIENLSVRTKRIIFLEENNDPTLVYIGLGNGYLSVTPKPERDKEKIDKLTTLK